MRRARRAPAVPVEVADGERLLASAALADGGAVGGTRHALYLPSGAAGPGWRRVPWEQVHDGSWDPEAEVLVLALGGAGAAGEELVRLPVVDPDRFLQLFRERVTSSVVLQRHVPLRGRLGVRVAVRRSGDGRLLLTSALDAGLDGTDPAVADAVATARREIAAEVGADLGAGADF